MYLVRRIVVGVEMPTASAWNVDNLEAPSRLAVDQAFRHAAATGTPLTLVTVLPESSAGWFSSAAQADEELRKLKSEAEGVLRDLASQLPQSEQNPFVVSIEEVTGRPWCELLRVAGNSADTLIVCGTRRAGSVARALFGSTGIKLLRNAAGPVWLVKPTSSPDEVLDILAATDLSEIGQDILLTAVSLARTVPSRLHVLHVVDNSADRYLRRTGISPDQLEEMRRQSREKAEQAVHEQLARTDFRTLSSGVQVTIADGPADSVILEALKDLNINVLVLATKGRGGVAGMLVGNTAETLLPEVPCSIIAIKPDDFVSPLQFAD